jgi:hypothetical protein
MKTALYLTLAVLIAPGCMVAYVYFVRPALEGVPALKKFYTEADTFWAKVWAVCGKSVTILWSYILAMIGAAVQLIDPVAAALGDPDLKGQVTNMLQANPKVLGYFAIFVSVVTILARLRSIGKT